MVVVVAGGLHQGDGSLGVAGACGRPRRVTSPDDLGQNLSKYFSTAFTRPSIYSALRDWQPGPQRRLTCGADAQAMRLASDPFKRDAVAAAQAERQERLAAGRPLEAEGGAVRCRGMAVVYCMCYNCQATAHRPRLKARGSRRQSRSPAAQIAPSSAAMSAADFMDKRVLQLEATAGDNCGEWDACRVPTDGTSGGCRGLPRRSHGRWRWRWMFGACGAAMLLQVLICPSTDAEARGKVCAGRAECSSKIRQLLIHCTSRTLHVLAALARPRVPSQHAPGGIDPPPMSLQHPGRRPLWPPAHLKLAPASQQHHADSTMPDVPDMHCSDASRVVQDG